jgi:hypothetical protein
VPVLAGASRSLFQAEAIAPGGEGEPSADGPAADVPLVEVAFRSEGEEIDRLQIFDDGRQVELRDGATEDPGRLSPARPVCAAPGRLARAATAHRATALRRECRSRCRPLTPEATCRSVIPGCGEGG